MVSTEVMTPQFCAILSTQRAELSSDAQPTSGRRCRETLHGARQCWFRCSLSAGTTMTRRQGSSVRQLTR